MMHIFFHEKSSKNYREEILTLKIALNETGSAGLGISLKARAVMKPDGTRHDCGIFIKKVNILHSIVSGYLLS